MKFSFILPAYKGRYLKESIDSILAQDYKDFELIIVDDCSPDNLHEIVSSFDDNRLSYHRNEQNIGGADLVAQWNHSLSFASGDYVILATDDDLYEPNFLSSFVPLITKYPEVALFRARVAVVDSDNHITGMDRCYPEFLTEYEFRYHMMHGIRGGIPHYIFRRDFLFSKGGFVSFPLAWGSDDATAMMMAANGAVTSQEHLVRFRYSPFNISSEKKHTVIPKIYARIQFIQWIREHPVAIASRTDWALFFQREIVDFLPIYIKQILIKSLSTIPWRLWPRAVTIIAKAPMIVWTDKCSVLLHSIINKL